MGFHQRFHLLAFLIEEKSVTFLVHPFLVLAALLWTFLCDILPRGVNHNSFFFS